MVAFEAAPDRPDRWAVLRSQLDARKRTQFEELTEILANISDDPAQAFQEAQNPNFAQPALTLRGAVPPTTPRRNTDVATVVNHSRGEKDAVRDIIASRVGKELSAKRSSVQMLRAAHDHALRGSRSGSSQASSVSDEENSDEDGSEAAEDHLPTDAYDQTVVRGRAANFRRHSTRDWEEAVVDYYRQAEIKKDDSENMVKMMRARLKQESQVNRVTKVNFERKLKEQEASIAKLGRRRRFLDRSEDYRVGILEKLVDAVSANVAERQTTRQGIEERRHKAQQRKEDFKAKRAFETRLRLVNHHCQKADADRLKQQQQKAAWEQVQKQRSESRQRRRQLETRHKFFEEQRKSVSREQERELGLLVTKRREAEARHVSDLRRKIQAHHAFDHFLSEAKTELTAHDGEDDAASVHRDMEAYERTLAAFRELAEQVRAHGEAAGVVQPILGAEARVRAALGEAEQDAPSPDPTNSSEADDRCGGLALDEDLFAQTSGGAAALAAAQQRPRTAELPVLPFARPPRRLLHGVPGAWSQSANPALEPFQAQQPPSSGGAPASARERAPRSRQSLAALRMIRRTGPL